VASCRLGQAHHALGNYERAAAVLRQVVASLQGDLAREHLGMTALPGVWARSWLAWAVAERGEFVEGVAASEEAARIAGAADHTYSRVQAAFGLGMLYVTQGRPELAIPVLEEGLVVARLASISVLVPFLTGPLGAAYAQAGQLDQAVPLLEQTVEQAASIGLVANHALRLVWLGQAQLRAGRREAAAALAHRSLQLAEQHHERGQQAYARLLLGDVAAAGGASNRDAAEGAYGEGLQLAESLGMRPLAARHRLGLGLLHQRAGELERAREQMTAAAAMLEAMGMTGPLAEARAGLQHLGPS
jgi:tetratricopeptide (TPR) repeat protein